jgi:hypothetical protein
MAVRMRLLQRCLKVFEGYPASCMDRIKGTDPSTVTEHGIFTRPAESLPPDGWGRGRVTLVGDAAHPVRPTGEYNSPSRSYHCPSTIAYTILPSRDLLPDNS